MTMRHFFVVVAAVALSAVAFGQPGAIPAPLNPGVLLDAYQVHYFANPTATINGVQNAGGYINITNTGELGSDSQGPLSGTTGRICVNVYAFSQDEQEISCCSCLVTPNALVHLTVGTDLLSNTLTSVVPPSIVVKLVATIPGTPANPFGTNAGPFTGSSCSGSASGSAAGPGFGGTGATWTTANLAPGMRAWATVAHQISSSPNTYALTEGAFLPSNLSAGEANKLTTLCSVASGNGSGAGICNSCTLGGLGASKSAQ